MGREPRYIPPNSLQHVTDVTFQNRHFLSPSRELNRLFLGILGRAQRKYDMTICAVAVMSTHVHYALRPRDGAHLAAFMCFLKTNIAKEIGKHLREWEGSFFKGRYHLAPVSDDEADQVGLLRYILGHGPKEFLTDTVKEWPGVHSAMATIEGKDMVGQWIDRTAYCNARHRKGKAVDVAAFTSEERVVISPPPCWQHLPEAQWRRAVADLVGKIDRMAAAEREVEGKTSLGVEKILAVNPTGRADHVEKSPQRRFHARDPKILQAMIDTWSEVIRCFREASEKLRSGMRNVVFPEGTFPPGLPFVSFSLETVQSTSRGRP